MDTVGLLLAAVVFSPRGGGGGLSVWAYRRVRAAAAVRGMTLGRRDALAALGLAVAAVGSAGVHRARTAASNHQLAVSGLLLHVVAVTVWAGGLLTLAVSYRATAAELAVALRRFSPLAGWCLAAVAASGVLSAWVRLPELAVIGVDPAPGRPPHPLRMLLVLASMILHAFPRPDR